MRRFDELEALFAVAPPSPAREGHVRLLVARTAPGVHETPEMATLDETLGLVGDRWSLRQSPDYERQLTLMNVRVAALVAADAQPLHMTGDNLLVDLDLGVDALPAGTRLRVGRATIEITAMPHNGCKIFSRRFGEDALRFISAAHHRGRRLRGVHARVVEMGDVRVGDPITHRD
jgi:MOSC domain-containing protein YiiM